MFQHYSGMQQLQFEIFAVQLFNHEVLGNINREGKLSLTFVSNLLLFIEHCNHNTNIIILVLCSVVYYNPIINSTFFYIPITVNISGQGQWDP